MEDAFRIIRDGIPTGNRTVTDAEITDALRKAYAETTWTPTAAPRRQEPTEPPEAVMARYIAPVREMGEAALLHEIQAGSDPLPVDSVEMAGAVLGGLYAPGELLFAGDRLEPGRPGINIRSATDWARSFRQGAKIPPFVIPNPLTGRRGEAKDGRPSFRCDDTVSAFHFMILEFDGAARRDQLAFYFRVMGNGLPVAALIDSGNKSVHAWVRVDCDDREKWESWVEQNIFPRFVQYGADRSCRNEARLSRMPGHIRDNGRLQRLLYLNPAARLGDWEPEPERQKDREPERRRSAWGRVRAWE